MAELERNGHGGDLVTAAEIFGKREREFLDFSSNMVPEGTPIELVRHLVEMLQEKGSPILSRYPDPKARALRDKLSSYHHTEPDFILVGNGAAELIDLTLDALRPKAVGVMEPAFTEYASASRKRGIPVHPLVTSWESDFLPNLDEAERWLAQVEMAFIGVPNNPTGHVLPEALLHQLVEMAEKAGTWLVLDEAFLDFVDGGEKRSFIQWVPRFPKLIVLRSMTKFFALPGLRLGYLVAQAETARLIGGMQTPWSVNGLAQAAGCFVLEPRFHVPYSQRVRDTIRKERQSMMKGIQSIGAFDVFPGQANYLLARIREPEKKGTAPSLQTWLGHRGILIRDCSMYEGLDRRHFRVAIKRREENEKLIGELTEWAGGGR